METPRENLVRSMSAPASLRADDEAGEEGVLFGEFAVFNEWTEINSLWEGRFLERIAPGAFDRTIADNLERVKVLYDHGHDPQLGNKPLGPIRSVTPTKRGMAYEVDLIDTDYNEGFIKPAARAGLLGASFRFGVRADSWVDPERSSKHNPGKLPERTLTDLDLYEFGPVTFPAYAQASAGMRSQTDDFLRQVLENPKWVVEMAKRSPRAAEQVVEDAEKFVQATPKRYVFGATNVDFYLSQVAAAR